MAQVWYKLWWRVRWILQIYHFTSPWLQEAWLCLYSVLSARRQEICIFNARFYIYKGSLLCMSQGSIFMRWGILINNWRVCIENLDFFADPNVLKNPFAKKCQACFWLWNWGGLPANCSLLILDVPTLLFVHSSCSGNTILVAQKKDFLIF